jgi:hypothetical protein
MSKAWSIKIFVICCGLLLLSGCAIRQGDFTILSTKNVEISRVDLKRIDFTRNVKGSDSRFWFLFIPFGAPPLLEEAADAALEKGGGDFMTSAVVYSTAWHAVLFGWESWTIKGDVGDSLSAGAADLPSRTLDTVEAVSPVVEKAQ